MFLNRSFLFSEVKIFFYMLNFLPTRGKGERGHSGVAEKNKNKNKNWLFF